MFLLCNFTAFTLLTREPSTAGICELAFNFKIWFAPVPESTLSVPPLVITPPSNPLPAVTVVTVPFVTAIGSHCEPLVFHPRALPLFGAVAETLRACNLTAFTLLTRKPSTAGICAVPLNCKIWLALVPTSTFKVPVPVILPPVRPVPAEILVTLPPAPQPPETVLQFAPAASQIVSTRIVPATCNGARGFVVPIPTLPLEVMRRRSEG